MSNALKVGLIIAIVHGFALFVSGRVDGLFMEFDIRVIDPVVSVNLITYNHAPYIRECLDSLLDQKTDFPYEICIGEDESTDGTREICQAYAEQHPDKIRLNLRSQAEPERRAYASQGVYNFVQTSYDCRGKYQAICDGDDAWIDSYKLQKQFDIMDKNAGISLVHSGSHIIDGITGHVLRDYLKTGKEQRISSDLVEFRCRIIDRDYVILSSTTFVKTSDLQDVFNTNKELFQFLPMGDVPVWCELTNYGSFHYIDEALAIYRMLPESDSNSRSAEKRFAFINGAANLGLIFGKKYELPMDRLRFNKIKSCNRYALLSGDRQEIEKLYKDQAFTFSLPERIVYHAGRLKATQSISKRFFEMRYHINNRRLRA
jgi:glycosyltransferase involved in cell wall biosynthesis